MIRAYFKMLGYERVSREAIFFFSFAYHVFQFGVDEGKASECCLVHGINEVLVRVGEPRLLAQELSVKVAAVTGGFLWVAVQRFQLG